MTAVIPMEGTSGLPPLAFPGDCIDLRLPEHPVLERELRPLLVEWSKTRPDRRTSGRHVTYFPTEHSWHSTDDLHELAPFRPLRERIEGLVAERLAVRLHIFSMWSILGRRMSQGERHDHRGRVSGVYYLDNGHADGEPVTGRINFHAPGGVRTFAPVNGQLLLFPATLEHDVEAYLGSGQRIVVAFNLR